MNNWFEELKGNLEDFFENATDAELQIALDKANYSFYKNIDVPIVKMNSEKEVFIYEDIFNIVLNQHVHTVNMKNNEFVFDELSMSDDGLFEYYTAA